jgi:uncharacterized membrane protein YecN with MAPEG domain
MHTPLQIAAFYVALNALVMLLLAANVVRTRLKTETLIGDGGNMTMLQAIRAHANNVEYAPLTLIMLVTLALLQGSAVILHAVGILLTIGRIAHGIGINCNPGASIGRGGGMLLTLIAALIAMVALLMKAFVF